MLDGTGSTAGLTVTGNGTAGTGGTIQNTTGADGATAGNGVYLNNARSVSLSWMQLNGHSNNAISGTTVSGFTLANSVINGTNGTNDSSPYNESSIRFDNLTGASSISSTSISGGFANNVRVYNSTGTLNRLTFTGVTVGANSTTNGNDGIGIEASGTATMNVTVQNSTFTSARGDLFQMSVPSGSGDLVFNTNTLSNNHPAIATGGGGVTISSGGTGTLTMNISGNTMRDAVGTAVLIVKDVGTGSLSGSFTSNQIGVAGAANSGSLEGAGLKVQHAGQGTLTLAVTNNQIRQYNNEGILLQSGAGIATSGTFNVSVSGNTLANPGSNASIGNIFQGLVLNNGVTSGDTFVSCLNVGANSLTGSGRNGGVDVRVRHRQNTTVQLPGYTGGQYDVAAVDAYLLPRLGGSPTRSSASSGTGGGFQNTSGTCAPPAQVAETPASVGAGDPSGPVDLAEESLFGSPSAGDAVALPAGTAPAAGRSPAGPFSVMEPEGPAADARTWEASATEAVTVGAAPMVAAAEGGGATAERSPQDGPVMPALADRAELARIAADARMATQAAEVSAPAKTSPLTESALMSGETVTAAVGTLPAGKTVTVLYDATLAAPFPVGYGVTAQGTVSGSN
ncbi:MAG TPA: hypothetical protein VGB53_16125, partial [Rubricoccaceae bacterium]